MISITGPPGRDDGATMTRDEPGQTALQMGCGSLLSAGGLGAAALAMAEGDPALIMNAWVVMTIGMALVLDGIVPDEDDKGQ